MKKGLVIVSVFFLYSLSAYATPVLYYKIVPHASGGSCQDALNNLIGTELYTGTSANGVPTVTDTTATYTVESYAEATQLCAQLSATPAPIAAQGSTDAANYASAAHPWVQPGASNNDPSDARCTIMDTSANSNAIAASDFTYLEMNGVCLTPSDVSNPPADPTLAGN